MDFVEGPCGGRRVVFPDGWPCALWLVTAINVQEGKSPTLAMLSPTLALSGRAAEARGETGWYSS